jgi:hypothetical protein
VTGRAVVPAAVVLAALLQPPVHGQGGQGSQVTGRIDRSIRPAAYDYFHSQKFLKIVAEPVDGAPGQIYDESTPDATGHFLLYVPRDASVRLRWKGGWRRTNAQSFVLWPLTVVVKGPSRVEFDLLRVGDVVYNEKARVSADLAAGRVTYAAARVDQVLELLNSLAPLRSSTLRVPFLAEVSRLAESATTQDEARYQVAPHARRWRRIWLETVAADSAAAAFAGAANGLILFGRKNYRPGEARWTDEPATTVRLREEEMRASVIADVALILKGLGDAGGKAAMDRARNAKPQDLSALDAGETAAVWNAARIASQDAEQVSLAQLASLLSALNKVSSDRALPPAGSRRPRGSTR